MNPCLWRPNRWLRGRGRGLKTEPNQWGTIEQIGATVCTQHCAVSADRSFLQGICLWTLYKESNMSRNEMLGKQSLKYFSSFNHPLLLLSMEWTDDWFIRWWFFFHSTLWLEFSWSLCWTLWNVVSFSKPY